MIKKKRQVLVVDDDPSVAESHVSLLQEIGYGAEQITDPDLVISYLDRRPDIQMVLLDMRMPKTHGLELLRKIKLFRPQLGVVMATVVNDIESAVKSTKAGAYNYLLKPLQ